MLKKGDKVTYFRTRHGARNFTKYAAEVIGFSPQKVKIRYLDGVQWKKVTTVHENVEVVKDEVYTR